MLLGRLFGGRYGPAVINAFDLRRRIKDNYKIRLLDNNIRPARETYDNGQLKSLYWAAHKGLIRGRNTFPRHDAAVRFFA